MTSPFKQEVDRLRAGFAEVSRLVAVAEGQLKSETERRLELERVVGEAKGRRERKPNYDRFLEEMQADAHAKTVGKFEKLLTTLVNEVMPGQAPIGLDLSIKRGQPALDIVSRVAADISKDVYKHKGGAMTNILSLGLRMIVLVVARKRRFIVLDESDCWTQSEKIPAFYNVVRDAASKLGVQTIAISHWSTDKYGDGVSVARLGGHPESAGGTNVHNVPRRYDWTDDEPGFRYVRLVNFQGYVNETLHLTPGTTIISGDNDLGKSSLVRAFRAMFYGDVDDGLIRDGERMCAVEIGLPGGRVLRWDRQIKRNPVNLWKLMEADGSVVTVRDENGNVTEQYETGGDVPEWVEKEFGIGKVQGLDVQLMIQKEPVFLLDETPQVRATVLSVGQEASYISSMITKHKEQVAADNLTIREGEKEMAKIIDRLARLDRCLEFAEMLPSAREQLSALEERIGFEARAEVLLAGIEDLIERRASMQDRVETLAYLPLPEDLAGVEQDVRRLDRWADLRDRYEEASLALGWANRVASALAKLPASLPRIQMVDGLIELGLGISTSSTTLAKAKAAAAVLRRLPTAAPDILDSAPHRRMAASIDEAARSLADARRAEVAARAEETRLQKEMDGIVEALGHACPVCGSHVHGGEQFLSTHSHGDAR